MAFCKGKARTVPLSSIKGYSQNKTIYVPYIGQLAVTSPENSFVNYS